MSQLQGVGANAGIGSENRIDGQEGAGRVSEQSQLHGEVRKASVGARSFFYHPATITLFTLFTGGLYGIVLLGHYFATKPSAIAKMSADSTEMPKIHNTKELKQYLRLRCKNPFIASGSSVEAGKAEDDTGKQQKVFEFKGIVFRWDNRPPKDIMKAGGFTSQNDLRKKEHMQEAMGLGPAKGATGKSGASCADKWTGAINYTQDMDNGRLYIIDTTKLDASKGQKAFYMKDILLKNGLKEKDESRGEVNITHAPPKAVVGWIEFDHMLNVDPNSEDNIKEQAHLFDFWLESGLHAKVEFNSKYKL